MQKEEILAEIRRTAKENGGKPVGKVRFERTTGIKEYEWSRYWARYSDAQREAGFEPNSLVTAYGDEYLIGKLIGIIRELKKFPTKNELQMMKHKKILRAYHFAHTFHIIHLDPAFVFGINQAPVDAVELMFYFFKGLFGDVDFARV